VAQLSLSYMLVRLQHRVRLMRGPDLSLTRFRGRLTRPNFGAEVSHEVQEEGRSGRTA
jgi:hypothetical protein